MDINFVLFFSSLFIGSFGVPTSKPYLESSRPINSDVSIIGGDVAAEGSAPYMVALYFNFTKQDQIYIHFICGGSLISTRTVLTAGHCVPPGGVSEKSNLRGMMGTNKLCADGQSYLMERNITHPGYASNDVIPSNDIALLITATKVELSKLVQPIGLDFNEIPAGRRTKANGWGVTDDEKLSDVLMELYAKTVDVEVCAKQMASQNQWLIVDTETQMCVFNATRHGMCRGDSGSALVLMDESGTPKAQIGIVSWGVPCAKGFPDVFTKVSAFEDWFMENLVP